MSTQQDERGAARLGRASPLPPDERRRAILLDVQPVVLARGAAVTTRELAQAAGVSEGTLFRVFADKATLVGDAAHAAVDPAAVLPQLDAIDPGLPLLERVTRVLEIGFERIGDTMRWIAILHELGRVGPGPDQAPEDRRRIHREWKERQEKGQAAVRASVARVLAPDAAAFGRPLDQVVALLDVVLVGAAMQQADAARRGTAPDTPAVEVLADHFLHGALAPTTSRSPS
ncbi:TetR/AcrR family transcriptional regulator [Cellulomonas edaphi]|uniref:TetR/AcrR family transcriptional regulator n=1 Tax=Cellulomonas edaphi TaxID=3053468 RepID=A0ABT7S5S4_9CELL|nr:TetR/AcrR family transcriptional regulator [Cellulomons edaphi]MDM7830966.1 TetR/AcrR family transcriptional regulator [Cellulomons edaphi]